MKKLFKEFLRLGLMAFAMLVEVQVGAQSAIRVADTLADLEQLYPNIEQPTAIVRGRLVRDDYSPSRIYYWNPDSTAATNDSVRPVRMGIGRWIYSTNATFIGTMVIGETNLLNVLRVKGFSFGSSGILMERSGIGTNGISIAGGIVSLRREDPGASRFIASFAEDLTTASAYLGGNAYSGFNTGRVGNVFAPGVDLTTTNENKSGGNLDLYPGPGTGTATPPRVGFRVPILNTNGATLPQSVLTVGEFRFPAFPSISNNTSLRLSFLDGSGTGTNFWYTNKNIRLVITNEGGLLRDYWIAE